MIIDIHNHPDWYGYTLDKFIKNMDEYDIDKTCLLSWETPVDEFDPVYNHAIPDPEGPVLFRRCVDFYEKAPDRFFLGYCPDPRKPDAIDRLLYAIKTYGINICGELKLRTVYDNPDALRMYSVCAENDLAVLFHLDYAYPTGKRYPRTDYWYGGGMEAVERMLKKCPDTKFIGHAPGFWAHLSGDDKYLTMQYPTGDVLPGGELIRLLDTYPNLFCDISAGSGCRALLRSPSFSKEFLCKYADRVLYGRDYFDNIHQNALNSFGLPEDVMDKIMYKNAVRLLNIKDKEKYI